METAQNQVNLYCVFSCVENKKKFRNSYISRYESQ